MVVTYSKGEDQPGKAANPARGQLDGKINISLSAFAPENLVSRDGFGSPVPRQPVHLHTQAESNAYLWDPSRVPRRCPCIYLKLPYAIGSSPSLSGHAIAYRWRSLPRVRRLKTSTPQGSSKRKLPWQVTMDQIICSSFSHTHLLYVSRCDAKLSGVVFNGNEKSLHRVSGNRIAIASDRRLGAADDDDDPCGVNRSQTKFSKGAPGLVFFNLENYIFVFTDHYMFGCNVK